MKLTEFSTNRAQKLNTTLLPDLELPLNLKIHWLETVDKGGLTKNVVKQNHQHTFYEVHFVFEGKISYEVENTFYKLNCGQAIIIPSFKNHRYVSCDSNVLKTAIAFSIDSAFLKSLNTSIIDFDNGICKNFNHILKQTETDNVFSQYIIANKTFEILYSLFESLSVEMPSQKADHHDPRFLVAKAFIENNKYKNISCTEVANECCLSTKQLNRIFKTETEKSVSEYINYIKIKLAKKLLTDNRLSIKEICFNLGFENESSFISFFKRHSGLTPGNFKKQMSEK